MENNLAYSKADTNVHNNTDHKESELFLTTAWHFKFCKKKIWWHYKWFDILTVVTATLTKILQILQLISTYSRDNASIPEATNASVS